MNLSKSTMKSTQKCDKHIYKLAEELKREFPEVKGFFARNLWRMRNFYIEYKDNKILPPLVAEFSWTRVIHYQSR